MQGPSEDSAADAGRRPWWLLALPLAHLLHLAEEWWGGEGFMAWTERAVGAPVSLDRFLLLNGIGWPLITILILVAIRGPGLRWFPVTFAHAVVINAALHLLGALATASYSPGMVTAALLYLPVGFAALAYGRRVLTRDTFVLAVGGGIVMHLGVIVVAFA